VQEAQAYAPQQAEAQGVSSTQTPNEPEVQEANTDLTLPVEEAQEVRPMEGQDKPEQTATDTTPRATEAEEAAHKTTAQAEPEATEATQAAAQAEAEQARTQAGTAAPEAAAR
jgi:hypothetical protein